MHTLMPAESTAVHCVWILLRHMYPVKYSSALTFYCVQQLEAKLVNNKSYFC